MYRIGIDLGGTNIAVGLVNDETFEIVKKKSTPTLAERDGMEIVEDMARLCREICDEVGVNVKDLAGVGVASPGIVNPTTGIIKRASNLRFFYFPITEILADKLGAKHVPVYAENDANAAAWGEACAGAAKGSSTSATVTLGTGVGSGIIIHGKILSGSNYAEGELGHMVIEFGGIPCTCGRRGCWESYSSATALVRMTNEKIEECKAAGRYTSMLNAPKVSGRTACDHMRAGDEAAKEVYDKYIAYLACGINNIINIFQPEVIAIGGGISGEGQSLIDSRMPIVDANMYCGEKARTRLKIATLGNDAGIIGAAMLESGLRGEA